MISHSYVKGSLPPIGVASSPTMPSAPPRGRTETRSADTSSAGPSRTMTATLSTAAAPTESTISAVTIYVPVLSVLVNVEASEFKANSRLLSTPPSGLLVVHVTS